MNRRQLVMMGWLVIVANTIVTIFNLFGGGTKYLAAVSIFAISIGARVLWQVHKMPPARQWWERERPRR